MSCRTFSRPLALAAIVALAACSSDSTAPDDSVSASQQSVDLALSEGAAIGTDVALMSGDMVQAGVASASLASLRIADARAAFAMGGNCTYSAASGSWTCARTRENGLDVDRTITFYSGGAAQQNYDANTTDSIRVHAVVGGTITGERGTSTVSHVRDVVISGLAGAETTRSLSGTGTWQNAAHFEGPRVTRTYASSVANAFASIVFPVGGGYPASGTLTHDVTSSLTVTGTRTETRAVSRHIVVTFNGTATVPITVGTVSCTLHLDTRSVTCPQ